MSRLIIIVMSTRLRACTEERTSKHKTKYLSYTTNLQCEKSINVYLILYTKIMHLELGLIL